jgi:hypothetical protein
MRGDKDWQNLAVHERLHGTFSETCQASTPSAKPSRIKVREQRERLRAQGLRPIQIWVPDTRSTAFRSEAHRQSAVVAASGHAVDDQAFIDAVSPRARSVG